MSGEGIRRQRMVRQLVERGIRDRAVLEAMGRIPRESFVEEALRGKAYREDASLPIGDGQTISQPWIVARMSELAQPDPAGSALEIGSGSGYHAAVLAQLFQRVFSVERIPELSRRARETHRRLGIENAHFKIFDGSYGWSEFAPYQAVVVTAAVPELPGTLIEQLGEGGRLVLPLLERPGDDEQILVRVVKREGRTVEERHGRCRFVPLVGKFGVAS